MSESPFRWSLTDLVMNFGAHAAEVIHTSEDHWFVSSAGGEQGGLYIADLSWF